MSWLTGNSNDLAMVAAKAAMMYLTAVAALRIGERRTFAEWSIIDFATAVAIGGIVGRTAVAGAQSFVTGAVALVALVACHRIASIARVHRVLACTLDHPVRVLIDAGEVQTRELAHCGLTEADLFAQLREQGVFSLQLIRFVLFEGNGSLTIVSNDAVAGPHELVTAGLRNARGYR